MTDQTDIRQRLTEGIADALRRAAHHCDGQCGTEEAECVAAHPVQVAAWTFDVVSSVDGPVEDLARVAADAAVSVVQPLLAAEAEPSQRSTLYDAEREQRPNTPPSRMRPRPRAPHHPDLRQRIADAVWGAVTCGRFEDRDVIADVVLAVVQPNLAKATARGDIWKAKAVEMEADRDRLAADLAMTQAGLRGAVEQLQGRPRPLSNDGLGQLAEARTQARRLVLDLAEAKMDRDRLAAAVQRVRQMADAWEQRLPSTIVTAVAVEAIRTALDTWLGPAAPAESARSIPAAHGHVQGRCPACGLAALFLGEGGYVTCGSLSCPEPDAASTLLERRAVLAEPNDTERQFLTCALDLVADQMASRGSEFGAEDTAALETLRRMATGPAPAAEENSDAALLATIRATNQQMKDVRATIRAALTAIRPAGSGAPEPATPHSGETGSDLNVPASEETR